MIRALWRYSTIDLSCSNLELSVSARSNRALAFSSLPLAWGFGCIIGPLIGGVLARGKDKMSIRNLWTMPNKSFYR